MANIVNERTKELTTVNSELLAEIILIAEAAEVQVGFEAAYRISWQTALLGGMGKPVFEENLYAWSGDHCSNDVTTVPGILMVSLIGVYGVMSYSVAQRTQEIGIRMALGAKREGIMRLVVGQGMALVLMAVVVGLLGSLAAAQVISSLLYGISPRDPATYAAVTGILVLVALVACWLPARRASSGSKHLVPFVASQDSPVGATRV